MNNNKNNEQPGKLRQNLDAGELIFLDFRPAA